MWHYVHIEKRNCHTRGESHKMRHAILKKLIFVGNYDQDDGRFVIILSLKVLDLYNSIIMYVKHYWKILLSFICFPQGFHVTIWSEI